MTMGPVLPDDRILAHALTVIAEALKMRGAAVGPFELCDRRAVTNKVEELLDYLQLFDRCSYYVRGQYVHVSFRTRPRRRRVMRAVAVAS